MILAAGLGTRLRPLTEELPKPLVPVGDAPAILQIQRHLAAYGIEQILLNSHFLATAFEEVPWVLPTRCIYEPNILGTAGGVANARGALDDRSPLLVWNGDILADIDVNALFSAAHGVAAAWCVAPRSVGEGTVGLDQHGCVVRVRKFHTGIEIYGGDFLGVQVLSPEVIAQLPKEGCLVGDVLGPMLAQGAKIQAVKHTLPWDDIGTLAAYLRANLRWLGQRPSFVGVGARVDAILKNTIVGSGAEVECGRLERVVVWPGAKVSGSLQNAIVTRYGKIVQTLSSC